MWIKAYVITEAELWLWVTLPAIICVIRSHESRCVWGLKCLGGALKAEIQMADNWCCRRSFTPLSTHLYSHDCRVDQQLSGPPKLDNPTGVHWLLEVTKPPGWKLKRLHEPKRKSASVVISNAEDWEPPPTDTVSSMKNWLVLAQWLNWIIQLSICFTWFIQPVNVKDFLQEECFERPVLLKCLSDGRLASL